MKICEKDDPKGMISICKFPLSTLEDIPLKKDNIIIEDKFSKFDNWLNG
jgi:hypothetical protein